MSEQEAAARPPLLRFGRFELDSATLELRQGGEPVRLQQQPAKVLALLLLRVGQLVTRDEIRGHVWGQDTYVNFDQGLNFCIKEIRAALGDSADQPRFVETLPRRGYRFIAPVQVITARRVVMAELSPPRSADQRKPVASGRQLALVLSVLGLLLLLTAILLLWPAPRARTPAARVTIAVLPFENLSADPEQDYLSEGLAEELIAQLGRLSPQRLAVIARATAQQYKGQPQAVERVGRELGVDYAVLGSVRRGGERVRITVSLVKVSDRRQLFSEAYEREARDLLTLQREIAQEIARKIEAVLTPQAAGLAAARGGAGPGALGWQVRPEARRAGSVARVPASRTDPHVRLAVRLTAAPAVHAAANRTATMTLKLCEVVRRPIMSASHSRLVTTVQHRNHTGMATGGTRLTRPMKTIARPAPANQTAS